MNCVTLVGFLATDVDFRDGMASTIIAVDRNPEEADFFRLKCFGTRAADFYDLLRDRKGKRVSVRGVLRQDIYDGPDGERKAVSVHVSEFDLLA